MQTHFVRTRIPPTTPINRIHLIFNLNVKITWSLFVDTTNLWLNDRKEFSVKTVES